MFRRTLRLILLAALVSSFVITMVGPSQLAFAAAAPPENPQEGSVGLEGTLPSPPPAQGATITTPRNGQVFTSIPIDVSGLCSGNLLIKVFINEVFGGSTLCVNGSYSLKVDLFGGTNNIIVRVYDALDQAGPDSNTVTVTFQDAQFSGLGGIPLSLTSDYARRGADPREKLTWPIILSGGRDPYAVSVDWGDGQTPSLLSRPSPGVFEVDHIYQSAGTYTVTIRATNADGRVAFLQLVAVANGAANASVGGGEGVDEPKPDIVWLPAAATIPLTFISFWLGRRYEITSLRKHLEGRDRVPRK